MSKLLVKCPKCEKEGITSILGELKPTGHLVIQRIYQYQSGKFHKKYTIIGGKDFFVLCDQCGETVYFKQLERRGNEMSYFGSEWFSRNASFHGTI